MEPSLPTVSQVIDERAAGYRLGVLDVRVE